MTDLELSTRAVEIAALKVRIRDACNQAYLTHEHHENCLCVVNTHMALVAALCEFLLGWPQEHQGEAIRRTCDLIEGCYVRSLTNGAL